MRYRVGEYCIDAELFEIRRGSLLIECQAQVFNLILFLIRQRDRVPSGDELLRALWNETRVDRASLTTAIKTARRVLGDTGKTQRVIETVWKRGYRFVAEVEELDAPDAAAPPAPPEPPPPDVSRSAGERRRLTALACDLVDALALPEDASAEDVHATVRSYRAQVAEVIAACGGSLAPSPGDELLAYFGYPEAHEDDPERAVHAALRILAAQPELAMRIGIDSGEVAIGPADPASPLREPLVFGRALNRAQRIQERAQPGTVLVSEATLALLRGAFETERNETSPLTGARPEPLHRVLRAKPEPHALDRVQAGLWSPLVGRADELRRLRQAWSLALLGQGRAVWISGDAGVGKSRLLRELRARVEGEDVCTLALHSSPLHASTPFHPLVEGLRALLCACDAAALGPALAALGIDDARDAALLCALLAPDAARENAQGGEDLHERTLAALIRVLLGAAGGRVLLASVEDLHWSDPSTLELLNRLVDQVPGARILLVLTARTHFVCPWLHRAHVQRLEVAPLDREQTQELTRKIGGDALPVELVPAIAQRSDGLPLFVEELTRTALAEGASAQRIPSTLQDALTARLDHVPGARAVAQVASVIGRRFSYVLLRALDGGDEARLGRALAELLRADLLYQEGSVPEASFVFRHALIRDAAYQSLLRPERERLHRCAAQALTRPGAELCGPEVLAYHFEEAGEPELAIEHYRQAGVSATRRQASREALAHLEHALTLLDRLPPASDRRGRELGVLLALTTPVGRARGYESKDSEHVLRRALDLAGELADEDARFHVLRTLVSCYSGRGDLAASIDCARQLLSLAESTGERERRLVAHLALAIPLFWCAQWGQSLQHVERTLALCADGPRLELADRYGWDQEVVARSYMAYALWVLGKAESALQMNRRAIELARAVHAPSLAQALAFMAGTHLLRREAAAARRCAEDAIRIASQHGLRGPLALAQSVRTWAITAEELPQGDSAAVRPGFGLSRSPTAPGSAGRPLIFGALAETYLAAGRTETALECVEHCLELLPPGQPYFFDAELYRLHGECLRAGGSPDEAARARFQQALESAREQGALALELRAALSLYRLDRARHADLLRGVVARHAEGFETGDLQVAIELLAQT